MSELEAQIGPDLSPPELHLQRLLRQEGLAAAHALAISGKRHARFPQLVCFKYSQLRSPMSEEAVRDARGLILNEDDDWAVVSMTLRKFFNLGESRADPIDWATARIEEKLDGSLMSLYPYAGQWHVQTSGRPDASGMVGYHIRHYHKDLIFRDLFWRTFTDLGYVLPPVPGPGQTRYTLGFEMITPENVVIVPTDRPRLVLHTVRNLDTLKEENAELWAARLGYEAVQTFRLSPEEIISAANDIPPSRGEGFVVRDAAFRRVKVKSSQYVNVSLLGEKLSTPRLIHAVLDGESDELLVHLPNLKPHIEAIKERAHDLGSAVDQAYTEIEHLTDPKAFSAAAQRSPHAAALFAVRRGRAANGLDWLSRLEGVQRLRALGIQEDAPERQKP